MIELLLGGASGGGSRGSFSKTECATGSHHRATAIATAGSHNTLPITLMPTHVPGSRIVNSRAWLTPCELTCLALFAHALWA